MYLSHQLMWPIYRFLSNLSENALWQCKFPIKSSVKVPFDNRSRVCSWYRVSIRLQHLPNLVKHQSRNHQFDDIINVARLTHKDPSAPQSHPIFLERQRNYVDNFSARLRAMNKEMPPLPPSEAVTITKSALLLFLHWAKTQKLNTELESNLKDLWTH